MMSKIILFCSFLSSVPVMNFMTVVSVMVVVVDECTMVIKFKQPGVGIWLPMMMITDTWW